MKPHVRSSARWEELLCPPPHLLQASVCRHCAHGRLPFWIMNTSGNTPTLSATLYATLSASIKHRRNHGIVLLTQPPVHSSTELEGRVWPRSGRLYNISTAFLRTFFIFLHYSFVSLKPDKSIHKSSKHHVKPAFMRQRPTVARQRSAVAKDNTYWSTLILLKNKNKKIKLTDNQFCSFAGERLCWLRNTAQPSSQEVSEERIWLHPHGGRWQTAETFFSL